MTSPVLIPCACEKCDRLLHPMDRVKYAEGHQPRRRARVLIPCACGCGTIISDRDKHNNPIKYVNGHGVKFRGTRGPRAPKTRRVQLSLTEHDIQLLRRRANGRSLASVVREELRTVLSRYDRVEP